MFYTFISHPDSRSATSEEGQGSDNGGNGGNGGGHGRPQRIEPQFN
jgi:hypothetical protein